MKKKLPHKFTNWMTLEEWKQFVYNYKTFLSRDKDFLKRYLLDPSNNKCFEVFIGGAFDWSKTPQGCDYWVEISFRIKPVQ